MTQWRIFSKHNGITSLLHGGSLASTLGGHYTTTLTSTIPTKFYIAYLTSDLRCNVTTFTDAAGSIMSFVDDTTNVNPQVSPSGTGWVEDTTGSSTPAVNSLCNYYIQNAGMHNSNFEVTEAMITLESGSDAPPIFSGRDTRFTSSGVIVPWGAKETGTYSDTEVTIRRSQTASNLGFYVRFATGASSPTFAVTLNGSPSTGLVVNFSGSGFHEDVTGSQAYASVERGAFRGATSGNYYDGTVYQIQLDTAESLVIARGSSSYTTVGNREYESWGPTYRDSTSVSDNFFMRCGSISVANFGVRVSTNPGTTIDISIRITGANSSNLTVSPEGTGAVFDLTGSESIADGGHLGFSLYSSSGTLSISHAWLEAPWSSTATGLITLQSISGTSSLDNVLIKANAYIALDSINGIASLSNVVVTTPANISLDSISGISSLDNLVVAAPILIPLNTIDGTSSLDNILLKAPAIISAQVIDGLSSLDNLFITAASVISPDTISGIASLDNIDIEAPSLIELQSVDGVANLPNVTIVTAPGQVDLDAINGTSSLDNLVVATPALITLQSVDGVGSLPEILIQANAYLSLDMIDGTSSLDNVTVNTGAEVVLGQVDGSSELSNVILSSPSSIDLQSVDGLSSLQELIVATPATILLDAINGTSSLTNITIETDEPVGGGRPTILRL